MTDEAAILPVVNRLYDAAASGSWDGAVQGLVEAMNAEHAILLAGGAPGDGGGFVASACVAPQHLLRALTPEAYALGACLQPMVREDVVTPLSAIVSERDWERSGYYNEIIRPMNGFYGVGAGRWQYRNDPFTLAVCRRRTAGDFDAQQIAMMQALLPHVATAVALHLRLRTAERGKEGLICLLDRIEGGIVLTDAMARPVFANVRARRISEEADGFLLRDDLLAGATPTATETIRDAIITCGRGDGEGRRIRLERPSNRPPLLLSMLPLSRLDLAVPATRAPRVAVFITEPDAPAAVNRLALAEVYRLTQRESEIAMLLVESLSVDAIAARLGIGRGTVRSHLARLFDKTNTHSQPALVALLRGFAEICH